MRYPIRLPEVSGEGAQVNDDTPQPVALLTQKKRRSSLEGIAKAEIQAAEETDLAAAVDPSLDAQPAVTEADSRSDSGTPSSLSLPSEAAIGSVALSDETRPTQVLRTARSKAALGRIFFYGLIAGLVLVVGVGLAYQRGALDRLLLELGLSEPAPAPKPNVEPALPMRTVRVLIQSTPPSTVYLLKGSGEQRKMLGVTPLDLSWQMNRTRRIELERPGYVKKRVEIDPPPADAQPPLLLSVDTVLRPLR